MSSVARPPETAFSFRRLAAQFPPISSFWTLHLCQGASLRHPETLQSLTRQQFYSVWLVTVSSAPLSDRSLSVPTGCTLCNSLNIKGVLKDRSSAVHFWHIVPVLPLFAHRPLWGTQWTPPRIDLMGSKLKKNLDMPRKTNLNVANLGRRFSWYIDRNRQVEVCVPALFGV